MKNETIIGFSISITNEAHRGQVLLSTLCIILQIKLSAAAAGYATATAIATISTDDDDHDGNTT